MPTYDEFYELTEASSSWVTNYNGSGINGYLFTGNNQELFLPAAGWGDYSELTNITTNGRYLSSTQSSDGPGYNYVCEFDSYGPSVSDWGIGYGCPIRPVKSV
jgi:hypothetical protein